MNNALMTLTLDDLAPLKKLLKRKERLLHQVAQVDAELVRLGDDINAINGRNGHNGNGHTTHTASRHGQLKTKIIGALQQAGKEGIHVKEIAKQCHTGVPNVRVWFHSTGKKIKNVKRVSRATYQWKA